MRQETIKLQFQTFPPLVKRGVHALILLRDAQNRFILGHKTIYPAGICRLLGGGVDQGEDPDSAAPRELLEETGLYAATNQLTKLAVITAQITDQDGDHVTFTTHLYFYDCGTQRPIAADDVEAFRYLTEADLRQLVHRFQTLSPNIDPKLGFAWSDYGQLYSFIHQVALEEVQTLSRH